MEKNLYQVWFQGFENIKDEKYLNNIKQWKSLNPEWNYKLLTEKDLKDACQKYSSRCIEAFNRTENMHAKIDMGRLVVIYNTGGINVDMDMYALRPLEYQTEIIDFLLNTSKPHKFAVSALKALNKFENLVLQGSLNSRMFNNAMSMSSKGNPILKYVIDNYIDIILTIPETSGDMIYVHKTTGPGNFNKFVNEGVKMYSSISLFKIFDGEIFEPCDNDGSCNITDQTVSIHQFDMTWVTPEWKPVIKAYLHYKIVVYMFLSYLLYKLLKYLFR